MFVLPWPVVAAGRLHAEARRVAASLRRAHRSRLDGLTRIGYVEALTALVVLTGAATALVVQHVAAYRTLSPVDEVMHLDATIKAPRAIPAGELLGEQAMRAAACRRLDSPYEPPPCGAEVLDPAAYQAGGFNTAYIHPPAFYRATHWLADRIAIRWGTDDVDSAGRAGVCGLAAGWCRLFGPARRRGAPTEAAAGVALLVAAWPPVWYSSSVVSPDATSLPVGAAVLYAAVAWGRSPFAVLVLPLAGWLAVSVKLTNVLVVGVACGYLLLSALFRAGAGRWRRVLTAVGASALLAGTAVVTAQAVERAMNDRALLPIGMLSTSYYTDDLSAGQVLAQWSHFLPPTTIAHAAPFLRDGETGALVATISALTGGLLLAGLLAALAGAGRVATTVALPTVAVMVGGVPLYALANYAATHGFFSVSARYGYALLPCSAAVLAAVVPDRRLARALLLLGVAVTATGIGVAASAH